MEIREWNLWIHSVSIVGHSLSASLLVPQALRSVVSKRGSWVSQMGIRDGIRYNAAGKLVAGVYRGRTLAGDRSAPSVIRIE